MRSARLAEVPSPLGKLLVVSVGDALRALDFEDYRPRLEALLLRYHPGDTTTEGQPDRAIVTALEDYFAGDIAALERLKVEPQGSAFQQTVWSALREIPAGTTLSYGGLAERVGRPGASRAVGAANGANPVALVVPCHRVIGANGSLTGYGGGIERKRWLLEHEGAIQRDVAGWGEFT